MTDKRKMTREEVKKPAQAEAKPKPSDAWTIYRRPLATVPATKPLGLAEQRARSRWQKPLAAIIADAMASNRGLYERLNLGIHGPDEEHHLEQYQVIFDGLYYTTQQQIEVLELFTKVDWSE